MSFDTGYTLQLVIGHFLIGLSGGFGHCVSMCHPFVLHISSKFSASDAGYKILIPNLFYNLGRTLTYTFLGAFVGFLGSITTYAGETFLNIQKLSAIIGGFILVIFSLLYFFNINSFNYIPKLPIFDKIKKITPNNPFLYGVLLGFLPCALSMNAFMLAIPGSSWITGGLMLFAFGIGTSFALMLLAVLGSYIMRYVSIFRHITTILLFIMGISYIYKGIIFSYN